jgi:hypothetical protein
MTAEARSLSTGAIDADALKDTLRRWTLLLGVAQVTFGCLVGFIPPPVVQWFRGIVMAHIEFTANGVLMIVLGLLVRELHLGPRALKTWFATLQLGTWCNGAAGLIGAFIGYSSKLMPTLNEKFPAPRGVDHPLTTTSLLVCGVTVVICLVLTLVGLARRR